MMQAKLKNLITGKTITVHSTTDSPDSSYGLECWVDNAGNSYGQIQFGSPLGFQLSNPLISETELAKKLNIKRQKIAQMRDGYKIGTEYSYPPKLKEGMHWQKIGRGVFFSPDGVAEVTKILQTP